MAAIGRGTIAAMAAPTALNNPAFNRRFREDANDGNCSGIP